MKDCIWWELFVLFLRQGGVWYTLGALEDDFRRFFV
jgi:hypothetical protein